jgi:biopolymer transport protein ExbD
LIVCIDFLLLITNFQRHHDWACQKVTRAKIIFAAQKNQPQGTSTHPAVSNPDRAHINPSRSQTLSPNQSTNKISHSSSPNINVTPLIDVLLVLLIIFMVISPRREAQLPVKAPQQADEGAKSSPEMLMLTVSAQFQLALNSKPILHSELGLVLKELMEQRGAYGRVLFIKAPTLVPYESVVALVDVAKGSGVTTVGWLAD